MKKKIIAAVAAAAFLPLLASAQFAKTEDAINYRQSSLFVMGQHFGRIGAMVNDKIPFDAAQAKESAAIVNVVGKLPWAAFGAEQRQGRTPRRARRSGRIPGKFKAAQERLAARFPSWLRPTDTGDKAKIKDAFGEAAGACKNCHDNFRAKWLPAVRRLRTPAN